MTNKTADVVIFKVPPKNSIKVVNGVTIRVNYTPDTGEWHYQFDMRTSMPVSGTSVSEKGAYQKAVNRLKKLTQHKRQVND